MVDYERLASEINTCREIAKEITKWGISERQRLYLLRMIALELENNDAAFSIAELANSFIADDDKLVKDDERE